MRKFIDIVNEAKVYDDGRLSGCRIWMNPSKRDIPVLSDDRDLRGLVDGNNVYVWPAEMSTHRAVVDQIGIAFHDDLLPFYIESDGYVMKHNSARAQWCDGPPDFVIGEASVYCNKDTFVVDDYLYSRGFCRMVGETPYGETPIHSPE